MTAVSELSKGGEKVRIPDQVYCLAHGEVHAATLDPYDEGVHSCLVDWGPEAGRDDVHRTVYWAAHKGDYKE